jgi:hypothetical protein
MESSCWRGTIIFVYNFIIFLAKKTRATDILQVDKPLHFCHYDILKSFITHQKGTGDYG